MAHDPKPFSLPVTVFGPVEIRRLGRELDALEDYLAQAKLRESGRTQSKLPRTSQMLESLAEENRLNLLKYEDRKALAGFIKQLQEHAPVLHMSFASDPSAAFTVKIVAWLRQNIHKYALLRLGLQPTIAAGCMLRTRNKWFDFSLRHRFAESKKRLIDALEAESTQTSPQETGAAPQPDREAAR